MVKYLNIELVKCKDRLSLKMSLFRFEIKEREIFFILNLAPMRAHKIIDGVEK